MADWLIGQGRLPAGRYPIPTTYEMTEADGWPFPDASDWLAAHTAAETDRLYARMPVIQGAPEALRELDRAGVDIRIVTSFRAGMPGILMPGGTTLFIPLFLFSLRA